MKVVITDVSVLFDLHSLQILSEFFNSDLEVHTTDFVYNQIEIEAQQQDFESFRKENKLNIITITAQDTTDIYALPLKNVNKSFEDLSLLWKAKQMACTLLTCDNKLRKEAVAHGITVHGSVWVIKRLVDNGAFSKEQGVVLLQKLKTINSRLPIKEIDEIIKGLK